MFLSIANIRVRLERQIRSLYVSRVVMFLAITNIEVRLGRRIQVKSLCVSRVVVPEKAI